MEQGHTPMEHLSTLRTSEVTAWLKMNQSNWNYINPLLTSIHPFSFGKRQSKQILEMTYYAHASSEQFIEVWTEVPV